MYQSSFKALRFRKQLLFSSRSKWAGGRQCLEWELLFLLLSLGVGKHVKHFAAIWLSLKA